MPTFRGSRSPSLRKMELNNGKFGNGGSKGFSMSNVFGDPFSLATIGIAICGWMIAFVSSIISVVNNEYPNYAWWALAYTLVVIIGVFVTIASNSVATYHVAIVGYLSAGLVLTTSAVNSLIYVPEAAQEAAGAGFILLSMVEILWIFYFGSQPQAAHRQTIDSFALHKDRPVSRRTSKHTTQQFGNRPETQHSSSQPPQMYNSHALAGFETSSPVTGYPGGRPGESKRESASAFPAPAQTQPQREQPPTQPASTVAQSHPDSSVSQPTEYPYRAKAIYSYEANPDDANEISFTKHEILEVSDVSGRWWQAKKENGETGIAPSNYLILL